MPGDQPETVWDDLNVFEKGALGSYGNIKSLFEETPYQEGGETETLKNKLTENLQDGWGVNADYAQRLDNALADPAVRAEIVDISKTDPQSLVSLVDTPENIPGFAKKHMAQSQKAQQANASQNNAKEQDAATSNETETQTNPEPAEVAAAAGSSQNNQLEEQDPSAADQTDTVQETDVTADAGTDPTQTALNEFTGEFGDYEGFGAVAERMMKSNGDEMGSVDAAQIEALGDSLRPKLEENPNWFAELDQFLDKQPQMGNTGMSMMLQNPEAAISFADTTMGVDKGIVMGGALGETLSGEEGWLGKAGDFISGLFEKVSGLFSGLLGKIGPLMQKFQGAMGRFQQAMDHDDLTLAHGNGKTAAQATKDGTLKAENKNGQTVEVKADGQTKPDTKQPEQEIATANNPTQQGPENDPNLNPTGPIG